MIRLLKHSLITLAVGTVAACARQRAITGFSYRVCSADISH